MHVYARATSAPKFRVAIVVTFVAALFLSLAPSRAEAAVLSGGGFYSFKASERCLMKRINSVRRHRGLRALNWDKQLGYVARMHANRMADSRGVWHDYSVGQKVTRWNRLAQNTGAGGRCTRIFRAFMRSSAHRSNIFGTWRFVGVGTEWRGRRLYVQQLFESRRDPGNIYRTP